MWYVFNVFNSPYVALLSPNIKYNYIRGYGRKWPPMS